MIASILIALEILNPNEDEVVPSSVVNTRRDAGSASATGGRS
jgi:hypothetical protein